MGNSKGYCSEIVCDSTGNTKGDGSEIATEVWEIVRAIVAS